MLGYWVNLGTRVKRSRDKDVGLLGEFRDSG